MPIAEWANEWDLSRRSIGSLWSRDVAWPRPLGAAHKADVCIGVSRTSWRSVSFTQQLLRCLVGPALMYRSLHAFRYVVSRASSA